MRILTLTTRYPNAAHPQDGIAVEGRLLALAATGLVDVRVVAPRPWRASGVPAQEVRRGLLVHHPRLPPLGGMSALLALCAAFRPVIGRLGEDFRFDLIDSHGLYPMGVAAALLARAFAKPFTITVHGRDLDTRLPHPLAHRLVRWALTRAAGVVVAAPPLLDRLRGLGVPPERLRLLPDGVDPRLFRPGDRAAARLRLGFRGQTLLAVGPFLPRRDETLIIEALALLPEAELVLVGDGPELAALADLAHKLKVARRIRVLGVLAHEALPEIYGAADALVLTGQRDGWPAAALEALACGTPVVATAQSGAAELVTVPEAGRLVAQPSAELIAEALLGLFAAPPDRAATRAFAERFGWDTATIGQIALFSAILGEPPADLAA